MTDFKESACRLCLKNVTEKGFQVIDDDFTRDILNVLLLKLKFCGESKEIICNSCRQKLNAALEFKSMCLNTDRRIIPHVDFEKMLPLDLGKVYVKENESGPLTNSLCNHKICRLCMHRINGETKCIGEEELEAIEKFIPEMNIMIVKDPVICEPCFDSLCVHNAFLRDCLEMEQEIKDIFQSSATESEANTSLSDLFIKTENLDEEIEINKQGMSIKTECVDIKPEEDEEMSNMFLLRSNNETFEASGRKNTEDQCGMNTKCQSSSTLHHSTSGSSLYKCNICIYETGSKSRFTTHCVKCMNRPNVYKCEICKYATKRKRLLQRHILRHKDSSEVQMYRCNECDYKTKHKFNLSYHVLQHKDPSEVQMYKCDACDFESIYKSSIMRHQQIHKDPSQLEIYRCKNCDYQTKYKRNLVHHLLGHKDTSQVQMYKCDICDYASRYKRYVTKHSLIHKHPSNVQMYKCNDCSYKTNTKYNLADHVLQHKDPSQVRLHKCDVCDYESRYKRSIIKHQLIHKDLSQVQMYKCNTCNYETRYKNNLANHVLRHKDRSPIQMYKCDACDFESRYKTNLTDHQLIHTDPAYSTYTPCVDIQM